MRFSSLEVLMFVPRLNRFILTAVTLLSKILRAGYFYYNPTSGCSHKLRLQDHVHVSPAVAGDRALLSRFAIPHVPHHHVEPSMSIAAVIQVLLYLK